MSFNQIAPATIQFRGITPWDRYPWFQVSNPILQRWVHNCYLTGTLTYAEIQVVLNYLVNPIFAAGLESKIIALYPFIGDLGAARTPLHDTLGVGPALNSGTVPFTSATLGTTALGLVSTSGTNVRFLETNITPAAIAGVATGGISAPGGCGWYERNATFNTSTSTPMGCNSENQAATQHWTFVLQSNKQNFGWCTSANDATVATAAGNAHYYGEASTSTLLTLYRDGTSIATNPTSSAAAAGRFTFILGGVKAQSASIMITTGYPSTGTGRAAVAYWTNGSLGASGATAMHAILAAWCTATGR